MAKKISIRKCFTTYLSREVVGYYGPRKAKYLICIGASLPKGKTDILEETIRKWKTIFEGKNYSEAVREWANIEIGFATLEHILAGLEGFFSGPDEVEIFEISITEYRENGTLLHLYYSRGGESG